MVNLILSVLFCGNNNRLYLTFDELIINTDNMDNYIDWKLIPTIYNLDVPYRYYNAIIRNNINGICSVELDELYRIKLTDLPGIGNKGAIEIYRAIDRFYKGEIQRRDII